MPTRGSSRLAGLSLLGFVTASTLGFIALLALGFVTLAFRTTWLVRSGLISPARRWLTRGWLARCRVRGTAREVVDQPLTDRNDRDQEQQPPREGRRTFLVGVVVAVGSAVVFTVGFSVGFAVVAVAVGSVTVATGLTVIVTVVGSVTVATGLAVIATGDGLLTRGGRLRLLIRRGRLRLLIRGRRLRLLVRRGRFRLLLVRRRRLRLLTRRGRLRLLLRRRRLRLLVRRGRLRLLLVRRRRFRLLIRRGRLRLLLRRGRFRLLTRRGRLRLLLRRGRLRLLLRRGRLRLLIRGGRHRLFRCRLRTRLDPIGQLDSRILCGVLDRHGLARAVIRISEFNTCDVRLHLSNGNFRTLRQRVVTGERRTGPKGRGIRNLAVGGLRLSLLDRSRELEVRPDRVPHVDVDLDRKGLLDSCNALLLTDHGLRQCE